MRFRPGQNLLVIAALMIVLATAAFAMPILAFAAGIICVLTLPLVALELRKLRKDFNNLAVEREYPGTVGRGRNFQVTIAATFTGSKRKSGTLRDELPPASETPAIMHDTTFTPGTHRYTYPVLIPTRGLHRFGATWIRLVGDLKLLEAQKSFPTAGKIKVLPESLVPDEELMKDALDEQRLLDQAKQTRMRGEGTEFESLSEYREGDDVRRIDWRSSARHTHLIMRRYQLERHRDVVILVDSGRLMGTAVGSGTKLDCAVDAALVIARVALQSGDRCGIGVFDSKVEGFLSPVAGVASHKTIIDRLYDIKPQWRETDFAPMFATLQSRQQKRSMIIILSDMMEEQTTGRYRAALVSLKKRHVVIFAALKTPLLSATLRTPIETAHDAAREAFALRLMREREQTLHTLNRNGVHILDVEPSQLTVPLLNLFLNLKQQTAA